MAHESLVPRLDSVKQNLVGPWQQGKDSCRSIVSNVARVTNVNYAESPWDSVLLLISETHSFPAGFLLLLNSQKMCVTCL